jgi:tungstate transport system substrate-binding protein
MYAGSVSAEGVIKLATTTSTYETGILDHILPVFEQENSCKVHVVSVGTGRAIQLGRNGDVDMILVHAPKAEKKFVDEGYGIERHHIMHNDFVVLGPDDDPAKIRGLKSAPEALGRIYRAKCKFISRGDNSGTDIKEKYLWYILLDRATYLFNEEDLRLKKVLEGDKDLFNPYGAIAVNPARHPYVNHELSTALVEWLTSPECRRMIDGYAVNGARLFYTDTDN